MTEKDALGVKSERQERKVRWRRCAGTVDSASGPCGACPPVREYTRSRGLTDKTDKRTNGPNVQGPAPAYAGGRGTELTNRLNQETD